MYKVPKLLLNSYNGLLVSLLNACSTGKRKSNRFNRRIIVSVRRRKSNWFKKRQRSIRIKLRPAIKIRKRDDTYTNDHSEQPTFNGEYILCVASWCKASQVQGSIIYIRVLARQVPG